MFWKNKKLEVGAAIIVILFVAALMVGIIFKIGPHFDSDQDIKESRKEAHHHPLELSPKARSLMEARIQGQIEEEKTPPERAAVARANLTVMWSLVDRENIKKYLIVFRDLPLDGKAGGIASIRFNYYGDKVVVFCLNNECTLEDFDKAVGARKMRLIEGLETLTPGKVSSNIEEFLERKMSDE